MAIDVSRTGGWAAYDRPISAGSRQIATPWFTNESRRSAIAGQPFAFKQKWKVVEVRWMQIISCRRFRSLWLYENRDQLRGRSPATVRQFALQALQYPSEVQRPESGRYTGTAFQ